MTASLRSVGLARNAHQAGHRLHQEVIPAARGIGSGLAKSADGTINQPRICLFQRLIIEAVFGQSVGAEILDEYIGLGSQFTQDRCAFFGLEVDGNRPLIAVGRLEIG